MNASDITIVFQNCDSFTGKWLYSEEYVYKRNDKVVTKNLPIYPNRQDFVIQTTLLNRITKIPLFGIFAGLTRMALAICHIAGHSFLGFAYKNSDHFIHAKKGLIELKKGLIEAIPMAGTIYALQNYRIVMIDTSCEYEACSAFGFKISTYSNLDSMDIGLLQNLQRNEKWCKKNFELLTSLVKTEGNNINIISNHLLLDQKFRQKVGLITDKCLTCNLKKFRN